MDNNQVNNRQQMPVEEEEEEDNRAIGNLNLDDEDDDDDNEPMDEEDDEEDPGNPGEEDTLEGGVAEGDESRTLASEADIVLYFLCTESFKHHPDHPILRPGIKVRIGLGKNTRLGAVMQRYVDVCNQIRLDGSMSNSFSSIEMSDLEFVHAAVLRGHDTAEQGALMKDDVVRVRQNRWEQNEQEREANRMQRESDLVYLEQMRQMVDKQAHGNVVLDCQGTPVISKSNAYNNQRMSSFVWCDAALVSRRCPWLGRMIEGAVAGLTSTKAAPERPKSVVSLPEPVPDAASPSSNNTRSSGRENVDPVVGRIARQRVQDDRSSIYDDEDLDDHPIQVLDFPPHDTHRDRMQQNDEAFAAAEIECDDESNNGERTDFDLEGKCCVVIPNHPSEAVRLLLEYCYTNRVVCLGNEAFRIAARTKPVPREGKGNLPPQGSKRWANRGEPTLSFDLAAAALVLAEEASMPRFSLMCEVAASHLVSHLNVIDSLSLCKRTQDQWGNQLQRLRRASMEIVFHSKPFGIVYDRIYKNVAFKEAVEERAALLVPALFTGTADAIEECLGKKRYHSYRERDWKSALYDRFRRHDQEDRLKRAQERSRNRKVRENMSGSEEYPLIVDELDALGNDAASRKCMKRLRGHSVRNSLRRAEKRERRGSH
ncbi:hypothetical protein ACA910_012858 [Epithemia clementina (nom. ined.)]